MNKKLLTLSLVPFMFIPVVNSRVTLKNEGTKQVEFTQQVKLKTQYKDFNGASLTIYNCADYIDEELIKEFEDRYNCVVNYYTFDTPENFFTFSVCLLPTVEYTDPLLNIFVPFIISSSVKVDNI